MKLGDSLHNREHLDRGIDKVASIGRRYGAISAEIGAVQSG